MYFVLFVCVIIFLLVSYKLFDSDIMQPSIVLCAYFAFAIMMGFNLYEYWHLYEYGEKTTGIILFGILMFIIGCLAAKTTKFVLPFHYRKESNHNEILKHGRIEINTSIIIVCTALSVFTLIAFVNFFRRSVAASSLSDLITGYKVQKVEDDFRIPFYLNVLIKFVSVIAYNSVYVFVYNRIVKKARVRDFFLLVIPGVYISISLLMANRGNILMLVMGAFVGWYIMYHRVRGWDINLTSRVLKKGTKVAIVTLLLFWLFMVYRTNRSISEARGGILLYLCNYISGALASFDLYLKQGGKPVNYFGEETFVVLNNNLHSLFGINYISQRYLEFRNGFGRSVVNVYTSFRRFYHDFGLWGVGILSLLQGFISTKCYYFVKNRRSQKTIDFGMVLYCYYFYTIPYIGVEDFFYSSNLSLSGILRLMILFVGYKLFF